MLHLFLFCIRGTKGHSRKVCPSKITYVDDLGLPN